MSVIFTGDADLTERLPRPAACFICGGTTPDQGWRGCLCGNPDDCGRCEGQHDPGLPCVALGAEAEDRRLIDRRA